jgi:hypothetical protein
VKNSAPVLSAAGDRQPNRARSSNQFLASLLRVFALFSALALVALLLGLR